MRKPPLWTEILTIFGGVAMAVGALDPLEGAPLILGGSGLVALATLFARLPRRVARWRWCGFALVAVGVALLWYISRRGGFGGPSGRSPWWGLLGVPYFAGWSLLVWGPGAPRWLCALGLAVGAWYLFLGLSIYLGHGWTGLVVLAAVGLLTIAGCLWRALRHPPQQTD